MKQDRSIAQEKLPRSAPAATMLIAGLILVVPGTANAGGEATALSTGSVEINVSVAARVAVRTMAPPVGTVASRPCLASNGARPSLPVDMLWPDVKTTGVAIADPAATVAWGRIGPCDMIAAQPGGLDHEPRPADAGWLLIRAQ